MLFWLKKAISYWLMPLPFCLLLVAIGALLLRSKRRPRAGRIFITTGFILLVLFSNKQVGTALLRPLEQHYPPMPEFTASSGVPAALADCETIVVLGGGHTDDPGLPATEKLSDSALSRIVEAVRIARALPRAKLLVSGPVAGTGVTHASVLAAAAVSLGVDPTRIEQIDTARDTDDEANEIRRRLGPNARFALVTSGWHMPRAMRLLARVGLHPVPCPADFLSRRNPDFRLVDWTCDVSGLQKSTWAVYERLGSLWLTIQGK